MPIADTRNGGYGCWRTSTYITRLHSEYPGLQIDQIVEAVRLAGPEQCSIRIYIQNHYLLAADTNTINDGDAYSTSHSAKSHIY